MTTRRTFLQTSALAAVTTLRPVTPRLRASELYGPHSAILRRSDPDLHAMAMRALDAAKSAGADYADVRFTGTKRRTFNDLDPVVDSETVAVGVRALANGAWGFLATTEWTMDGMAKLGHEAALQAQANAWPNVPLITLSERPPVATGHWRTPVTRDPFTVPVEEVAGLITDARDKARQLKGRISMTLIFECQDRTFASTDGAFVTQTISTSLGGAPHHGYPSPSTIMVVGFGTNGKAAEYTVPLVSPVGAGYEAVEALGVLEALPGWMETASRLAEAKPLQTLGEYDVVFDAYAMAAIVSGSVGSALEYDRVIGDEANASGTSAIAPPEKMLGNPWIPHPVTIVADRTMVGGAGTVRWDDEGIAPRPTPLIDAGIVVDYATSRAFAPELAAWYRKAGKSVQSNGCAASENALTVPLVHTPNLTVRPGGAAKTFDALVSGIDNGYAILGGEVTMDVQRITGRGKGDVVYAITHGKLGAPVSRTAYTFKSQDFWKNVVALGGVGSAVQRGLFSGKGQPEQVTMHTVRAVPARVQRVRLAPLDQS